MDRINTLLTVIIIALVASLILLVLTSLLARRSMMLRGHLPQDLADTLREQLVEEVKRVSHEPGTRVALARFWRGANLSAPQRYFLLRPLLHDQILRAAPPAEGFETFLDLIWRGVLSRPARSVVLNSRSWWSMTKGAPTGVVIGSVNGSIVQIGDQATATLTESPDSRFALKLIAALREDARLLRGDDEERIEALADSLETNLKQKRTGQVRENIQLVTSMVSGGSIILASSARLLGLG